MDEEFTTTAYLNVQENLKLLTEDQVILEEPTSSTETLYSLQNLDKDLTFTDQFFVEKPQEEEPGKTNAEAEVQLMVSVPIHQDTSSVPPMTTPVIDLTRSQSHSPLLTSTATNSTITTSITLPQPPLQSTTYLILIRCIVVDEIVTDAVDWAMQAPLRARFRDLPTVDMKEILQKQMFEDNTYKTHEVHNELYEALQKSVELEYSNQRLADQEEARKQKTKRRESPRTPLGSPPTQPPPPPLPAGASSAPGNKAPSSSKTATLALQYMAWTTSDTQHESVDISGAQESSPTDYLMQDDSIPEEQASALATTYEPPAENSLLTKLGDITTFMNWYCQKVNKTKLTQVDFEGQVYEVVKAFYPDVIHLQFQMEECHKMLTDQVDWTNPEGDHVRIDVNRRLPLGGPPGHVTIQPRFFFNKDLEYLRYGSKGSNPALSISKMKAASYPDFGLKLLVPEQMWIDDVCTYDISAKYGISHCVIRIKAYSRYGYDYLSKIFLRRAEFQEYTIAEKDFKNLYPSDFEDLNLLLLQGHLDHLPGSDKRMLSTAVKQWT
ncbi:hypothetical protein Tco_0427546 [Tanacetum coccineum]